MCIKQVPNTTNIRIDPVKGTLIRTGVESIMNPLDKNAIEAALILKETMEGKVVVLSMGPPQAADVLREALAMGADEAIFLTDKAFAGADTMATSYTLSCAIKKYLSDAKEKENYIVLCGQQAIDGDTAQVGPQLAEALSIPQITYATKIVFSNNVVRVSRQVEDGYEVIDAKIPALITVLKEINRPRYIPIDLLTEAYEQKQLITWGAKSILADVKKVGLEGSATQVVKIFTPKRNNHTEIIKGSLEEMSEIVVRKLKEANILRV